MHQSLGKTSKKKNIANALKNRTGTGRCGNIFSLREKTEFSHVSNVISLYFFSPNCLSIFWNGFVCDALCSCSARMHTESEILLNWQPILRPGLTKSYLLFCRMKRKFVPSLIPIAIEKFLVHGAVKYVCRIIMPNKKCNLCISLRKWKAYNCENTLQKSSTLLLSAKDGDCHLAI